MQFSREEQETVIVLPRGEKVIKVYSSDRTAITKLLKITDDVDILTTHEGSITSGYFYLDSRQVLFRNVPANCKED